MGDARVIGSNGNAINSGGTLDGPWVSSGRQNQGLVAVFPMDSMSVVVCTVVLVVVVGDGCEKAVVKSQVVVGGVEVRGRWW
jgi:hypothetical protein